MAANTIKNIIRVMIISLSVVYSLNGMANRTPAPESIPGVTKVDAEGLIKAANEVPNLIIIDSRVASDRKLGFIEGSVNLTDENTNCISLAKVIPKLNSPVLFYCNGVKCGRSVIAIEIAQKCGYNNIYWFRGGFEEWLAKRYPVVHD